MKNIIFHRWETFQQAFEKFKAWSTCPQLGLRFVVDEGYFDYEFMVEKYGEEETRKHLMDLLKRILALPKEELNGSDFGNVTILHCILFGKKPNGTEKIELE